MLKELFISMRPKQWYKNLVIFVSIIFSLNVLNAGMWIESLVAFFVFCMVSGGQYIINDIIDREKDMRHPQKMKRPIASGKLGVPNAVLSAILIFVIGFALSYMINILFFAITVAYLLLMVIYSTFLKHFIIVDLLVIACGFMIRAVAGGIAIEVFVSPWLIICAFWLALFLGICKRKSEFIVLGDNARKHRGVLGSYSIDLLNQLTSTTTAVLIMSYSLYTFLTGNHVMMITGILQRSLSRYDLYVSPIFAGVIDRDRPLRNINRLLFFLMWISSSLR